MGMARMDARACSVAFVRSFVGRRGLGTDRPSQSMSAAMPAVILKDLSVLYQQHLALDGLSGQFDKGSLTAVMGPNGSGKSTLLQRIAGVLKGPSDKANGALHVRVAAEHIAYLSQKNEWNASFPITVLDCVSLGCMGALGLFKGLTSAANSRVEEALQWMQLQGLAQRPLGALSAGQLQRVMLARLAVQKADLILLDEPFNALDEATSQAVLTRIKLWQQEGKTVIVVLHDPHLALAHFDQTLLLARSLVAWGPTEQVLNPGNWQQAKERVGPWGSHILNATNRSAL